MEGHQGGRGGGYGLVDPRRSASDRRIGPAFAGQVDGYVGAQDGVLLVAADPLVRLGRRSFPGGEGARVEATNTASNSGAAGWPLRWWVAVMARRTA
jgi:hypothetical protein